MKIPDTLRGEIGELLALGAVEWLEPQIVNSFIACRIHYRFAILVESHQPDARPLEVQPLENLP